MDALLDNNVIEAGGWLTAGTGIILQAANYIGIESINPYLTGVTTVLGGIFIIYKILHIRMKKEHKALEIKREKLEIENQEMENKMLKGLIERKNSKDKGDENVD